MNVSIATINVNGLRNDKKRYNIFNWVSNLNYDIICLQETHSTDHEIQFWSTQWKKLGGNNSFWNNGLNDSRGVAILTTSKFKHDIIQTKQDDNGRMIACSFTSDTNTFNVVNIYAPNIPNDRIMFFTDLGKKIKLWQSQNVILTGDFNCCLDNKLDRQGKYTVSDKGTNELKNLMLEHNLSDVWRNRHPTTKQYTFMRNHSKSRIDMILISNTIIQKINRCEIRHCPYSDHNLTYIKINLQKIDRGPSYWKMNSSVIKDNEFKSALEYIWAQWRTEKVKYENIGDWWENTKIKLKQFTIEISRIKNIKKRNVETMEKELLNRK